MSAQKFIDILFNEYAPDFGGMPRPEAPGYLVDAVNVRSTPNGYRGMATFANVGSATVATAATESAAAACYYGGSTTLVYVDPVTLEEWIFFVSDPASFFIVTDAGVIKESRDEGTDTWQTVTPSSGSTLSATGSFVLMNGDAIYVDYTRAPVKKTLSDSHATVFSNLAGSPPIARYGARVRDHLVLAGLVTPDDEFAIQTSAIGDHEDWPTAGTADARAKQSIYQSLNQEYGVIKGILGGEKIGIVVQDQALTRMTYVGGSVVYEFDTYERMDGGGLARASRFATDGELWYWHNDYGVYATDGYTVKSVSEGRIDEAIFNNSLSHANGSSFAAAQSAAYDPRRSQVIFANRQGANGAYHLAYNVKDGNFSFLSDSNVLAVFPGFSGDENGARHVYNLSGADYKLQKLNNSSPTIALQTGYVEIDPGYRVQIQGAHLLGANLPTTLALSYKASQTLDDIDVSQSGFTAFTAANRGLKYTGRADAPFFAFRVTGTGAESHLYRGIRVYYERTAPN